MSDGGPSTVVVGFDALDFEYLDAFADALPNFSALRSTGVEAPLRSTFPPWTGSAWPSMYTGVDPSHHGVYGFFDVGDGYPDEADLVTRNDVQAPAIWNYLDDRGHPSIVLNVPVTHPAEGIEGVVVPGYLATEDAEGSPPDIRDELSEAIGEPYRIYSRGETSEDPTEKLDGYLELIGLRERAAEWLLTEFDWRVAVVQVQKTDAVFHNFSDPEAFRRVYRAADDLLGTVLEAAGDANVVVCSDHGIGPTQGYRIYVNEVLRRHGLLQAGTGTERPSLATRKTTLTGEAGDDPEDREDGDGGGSLAEGAVAGVASALERVGVTPGDVYTAAERLGVEEELTRILPDGAVSAIEEHPDWRASRAYCRSGVELGVRVNLQGREPDGVVPPEEYESVRSEIVRALSSLRTPDGEPAFDLVERREEVYEGPLAGGAPDVVFRPAGMDHTISTKLIGEEFVPVDAYDHKPDGCFVAAGPAFEETASVDALDLTDVAPIVLASAGREVPERMTGTVPDGLLEDPVEYADYGDVDYGSEGRTTEGEVRERLEDLGYV